MFFNGRYLIEATVGYYAADERSVCPCIHVGKLFYYW